MSSLRIDFYYSISCGHCRRFSKTVEKIEQERTHITVSRIEYKPGEHSGIKYIPTIVVSHSGKELGRFSSALTKTDIDNWLDQLEKYIKTYPEMFNRENRI